APAGVSDTVQVLATGSGATPGILQPGDSGRIPVYYIGLGTDAHYPLVTFSLSNLTADDVSWTHTEGFTTVEIRNGVRYLVTTTTTTGEDWHIAWPTVATRPQSVAADAWSAVVANLSSQIGDEWGNYVEALANDANALYALGQSTQDVGQLWNFEI